MIWLFAVGVFVVVLVVGYLFLDFATRPKPLKPEPDPEPRNETLPESSHEERIRSFCEDRAAYDGKTFRKKYPVRLYLTWSMAERLYHAGKRNDERAMMIWARLLGTAVRKVL